MWINSHRPNISSIKTVKPVVIEEPVKVVVEKPIKKNNVAKKEEPILPLVEEALASIEE